MIDLEGLEGKDLNFAKAINELAERMDKVERYVGMSEVSWGQPDRRFIRAMSKEIVSEMKRRG